MRYDTWEEKRLDEEIDREWWEKMKENVRKEKEKKEK